MKFAIIPWDKNIKNDNIYLDTKLTWHVQLKEEFERQGHEFHTIDCYKGIEEVDWFLFWTLDYKWIRKVLKSAKRNRMIYCNAEPAVVRPENSKEGYKQLCKIFVGIMTWNDSLIDNKRIYKRCIPYLFHRNYGDMPFAQRKLMVNISGNKYSNHPDELYSERERVITYFEKNTQNEFDLFGTGWDKKIHPSYLGTVKDKSETYHKYRFALCLENTKDASGYLTEKLFDCLVAGIVPVYWGDPDINKFVPPTCYIDYTSFASIEEMRNYLLNMEEITYKQYLGEIDKLLETDIQKYFTGTLLAKQMLETVGCVKKVELPELTGMEKRRLIRAELKDSLHEIMLNLRISLKHFVIKMLRK